MNMFQINASIPLQQTAGVADAQKIEHAAKQLENQFARMLIKSMRDASFGDALFPGENTHFRDLHDQKIAEQMTKGKGLGLAPIITRQLSQQMGASASAASQALPGEPVPLDLAAPLSLNPNTSKNGFLPISTNIAGNVAIQMQAMRARVSEALDAAAEKAKPSAGIGEDRAVPQASTRSSTSGATPSPEEFVAEIWPHAQKAGRELGVNPKALVAQAALETGWGRHSIGGHGERKAHNLFGIKAGSRWNGASVETQTNEFRNGHMQSERASFRKYESVAQSFQDYVNLLKGNARYNAALASGSDVTKFASALQRAGYATDPNYAEKIQAISNGPTLDRALAHIELVAANTAGNKAARESNS